MNRIAYLVSDFAAPSHTFVRRELAGLRALGIEAEPYSIQKSSIPNRQATELLGQPFRAHVVALVWALLSRPKRFFSAWRLALQHRAGGARALLWSQFHFVEAMTLARMLSAAQIGRLHNHFANSGATVGMIAAQYLGIPWSLTLHGISETDYPAGMLLSEKLQRADFVACASHFMQAQAMRVVDAAHWPKFHIVRCGIDLKKVCRKAALPNDGGTPRLICVGRLSPEKGHLGLFEALSKLAAEGLDFSLTVVGDGPSARELQDRVRALGIADQVHFAGFLSETETLEAVGAADIFVLTSFMEGLPVVLIEALAMEKPVIASRVAGIPELIEHDVSGLLFTPSNWNELHGHLRTLLRNRSAWPSMGHAGRRRVEAEFQLEAAAAKMAALLVEERPE